MTHLTGAETYWMKEIIGRQPIQRDREAEFVTTGVGAAELKARLQASGKTAQGILSSLSAAQLEERRTSRDRNVTVRWGILHMIEHYATHLGHIELTRQLWSAQASGRKK